MGIPNHQMGNQGGHPHGSGKIGSQGSGQGIHPGISPIGHSIGHSQIQGGVGPYQLAQGMGVGSPGGHMIGGQLTEQQAIGQQKGIGYQQAIGPSVSVGGSSQGLAPGSHTQFPNRPTPPPMGMTQQPAHSSLQSSPQGQGHQTRIGMSQGGYSQGQGGYSQGYPGGQLQGSYSSTPGGYPPAPSPSQGGLPTQSHPTQAAVQPFGSPYSQTTAPSQQLQTSPTQPSAAQILGLLGVTPNSLPPDFRIPPAVLALASSASANQANRAVLPNNNSPVDLQLDKFPHIQQQPENGGGLPFPPLGGMGGFPLDGDIHQSLLLPHEEFNKEEPELKFSGLKLDVSSQLYDTSSSFEVVLEF